jgi:putative ABC transport system permease protein
MRLSAIWRIARRDLSARIRGLRLLAVCLFLGVATLAAIGSLTAGIADELSRRGQSILGGDIQISIAQREATEAELAAFRKAGKLSETVRMRAMAIGTDSVLAELKAIDGTYPLYGKFEIEPNNLIFRAPPKDWIYVGPSLANRLGVDVGNGIRFGEKSFIITGIIKNEPDRLGEGFTVGPVAIIPLTQLPATKLIQPGSMFESKYRIKLRADEDPTAVTKQLTAAFPNAGWEITDRSNGAPGTRRFI